MDIIRSVSRSMWRSLQRYVICFSRDNIIIIFFPDKNLLLCDMIVSRSIYAVHCMGKWREGERQKVDSKMKE